MKGETDPALCTPNSKDMTEAMAGFPGVELGDHVKRVARLACAGGAHVAFFRAEHSGLKSCRAAAVASGGGKGCTWGCLGLSDCEDVCEFDAIHMNKYGLPIVNEDPMSNQVNAFSASVQRITSEQMQMVAASTSNPTPEQLEEFFATMRNTMSEQVQLAADLQGLPGAGDRSTHDLVTSPGSGADGEHPRGMEPHQAAQHLCLPRRSWHDRAGIRQGHGRAGGFSRCLAGDQGRDDQGEAVVGASVLAELGCLAANERE